MWHPDNAAGLTRPASAITGLKGSHYVRMAEKLEVAWAAGFFDGEGSTSFCRNSARECRLVVAVGQLDRTVLERFQDAMCGVGHISTSRTRSGKPLFQWRAVNGRATEVLARLWPYISSPKTDQALRAEAAYDEYRKGAVERIANGWKSRKDMQHHVA